MPELRFWIIFCGNRMSYRLSAIDISIEMTTSSFVSTTILSRNQYKYIQISIVTRTFEYSTTPNNVTPQKNSRLRKLGLKVDKQIFKYETYPCSLLDIGKAFFAETIHRNVCSPLHLIITIIIKHAPVPRAVSHIYVSNTWLKRQFSTTNSKQTFAENIELVLLSWVWSVWGSKLQKIHNSFIVVQ